MTNNIQDHSLEIKKGMKGLRIHFHAVFVTKDSQENINRHEKINTEEKPSSC